VLDDRDGGLGKAADDLQRAIQVEVVVVRKLLAIKLDCRDQARAADFASA